MASEERDVMNEPLAPNPRVVYPPGTRRLWHLLGFLLLLAALGWAGLKLVSPVMGPLAASVLIAYLSSPLVAHLEKRGLGRDFSVALILGGMTCIFLLAIVLLLPSLVEQTQLFIARAPEYAHEGMVRLDAILRDLAGRLGINLEGDLQQVLTANGMNLQELASKGLEVTRQVSARFFEGTANFLSLIVDVTLVPVFAYYFMVEFEVLKKDLLSLVPRPYVGQVAQHAAQIDTALMGFIRGQIIVCGVLAVLYSAGLLLVGIDFGLLIGLAAGVLFIVPYLGTLLGLVAASVMALIQFGLDWHLLGVFAAFSIPQALETYVLTPRIMSSSVGLNPVVVVCCLTIGASYFGVWGMVLAVPVTAGLMIIARTLLDKYLASSFYHSVPGAEAPPSS